jgi:hypothetical protein
VANFASGRTEKVSAAFGLRVADVAPGQGSVTISYESQSFKSGAEISAAALVLWLLLIIFI